MPGERTLKIAFLAVTPENKRGMHMKIQLSVLLLTAVLPLAAQTSKPIVIAHRGASGYLPEHTLPAKALAYGMGVDYLEQDISLSKDNIPVLLHDLQVDAVSDVAERFPDRKRENGRYYAIDFTLAELKQLAMSERFNYRTGQQTHPARFPKGQSRFSIVTLEEELQFIQGLNKSMQRTVGIYPEIKAATWHRQQGRDVSRIVVEILTRYGYTTKADPVFVQSFEFSELKRIREELGYQGRLILLLGDKKGSDGTDYAYFKTPAGLAEAAKIVDGIGPSLHHIATGQTKATLTITDLVRDAHALHLKVHPYTARADDLPPYASSLEEMLEVFFRQVKVDGMFADHPDRLVKFLQGQ
jgi:glycerophosphoryl diester phosphodiesterase